MTSACYGWDQHDPVTVIDGCIHALQIFDVVLAHEQINEWAQPAAIIEQMRLDGWILSR